MRVAIIHYWLVGMRGGEKVVEALCRMYPQADIYTHCVRLEALSPLLRQQRIQTTFIQSLPRSQQWYKHYLPLMPLALEQLNLRGYDLVISSESGPAKGVLVPARTPHVCYCHTPMRYLWDFYHEYLQAAGWCTRLLMRPLFHYLRLWDVASAQRTDRVVANSNEVAQRVARWWGREARVVHPPVDVQHFASPQAAPGENPAVAPREGKNYYLYFGQLVAYKRVDVAIAACTARGRRLIVAGDGEERERLQALAGPSVTFEGRVDDARLQELYASCRGLLFPGEEDFGIVPVEAMAAGCPVFTYGRGGTLETVVDGETGLFFPAQTPEALDEALTRFESGEVVFDPAVIRRRAELFTEARFQEGFAAEVALAMQGVRSRRV